MRPAHNVLLVSAGETSGDLMAAGVLRQARAAGADLAAFGLGGAAARGAGLEAIVRSEDVTSMGLSDVARRGARLLGALWTLDRAARARRPGAALLVGFSEFNAHLGRRLGALGTRVLWYAPPQVWAWRPGRRAGLARSACHLALTLPFEEALWQGAGADARFVGHPSLERAGARGTTGEREAPLALLPGSREAEVRRTWPAMRQAVEQLSPRTAPLLVIAPGLPARTIRWLEHEARRSGIRVATRPAAEALTGCDLAVVTSGTATVDCVAAGVVPVIVYRTDPLTFAVARRLVRVPWIGLPNLVLGRRIFPELIQDELTPGRVAAALRDAAARLDTLKAAAAEVAERLRGPPPGPSVLVAERLCSWLGDARAP